MGYTEQAKCKNCGQTIHRFISTIVDARSKWNHPDGTALCAVRTYAEPAE